jgi:hypothetical protein
MTKPTALKHEFVEFIPEDLDEGTVYVSIRFATASHKCCCGCGNKVVTPIRPTDWKLIFDGKTISLDPSIGNWSFPCRSHYWIRNNQIQWAGQWSEVDVNAGRAHDSNVKQKYFDASRQEVAQSGPRKAEGNARPSRWRRIKNWLS